MKMTEPDTRMTEALSPEEIRAWRRMTKAEREAANKKAADWYASLTD